MNIYAELGTVADQLGLVRLNLKKCKLVQHAKNYERGTLKGAFLPWRDRLQATLKGKQTTYYPYGKEKLQCQQD